MEEERLPGDCWLAEMQTCPAVVVHLILPLWKGNDPAVIPFPDINLIYSRAHTVTARESYMLFTTNGLGEGHENGVEMRVAHIPVLLTFLFQGESRSVVFRRTRWQQYGLSVDSICFKINGFQWKRQSF